MTIEAKTSDYYSANLTSKWTKHAHLLFKLECFSGDSSNIDNGHHGFLHGLYRAEFVRPVEIQTASKDIRARESHE
jgi:hypothetical protein